MARAGGRSTKKGSDGRKKGDRARKKVSQGVSVHAVKATSGRAITSVHVELEPEQLQHQVEGGGEVAGVIAEIPSDDGDGVRWQDQRLDKAPDEPGPGGSRKLHFTGTHTDGEDSARYGIGVRLETKGGTLRAPRGGHVKNADQPDD